MKLIPDVRAGCIVLLLNSSGSQQEANKLKFIPYLPKEWNYLEWLIDMRRRFIILLLHQKIKRMKWL